MSFKSCARKHCNSHSTKGLKSLITIPKHKHPQKLLSNITTCSVLNTQDLSLKLDLIKKIYQVKSTHQKQLLLNQWPNIQITQRITLQLMEIKPEVFFLGDVTNNLIHGYGLVIYNKQRFYEGYFLNNLKHGPGFEKLDFGVYVGNYINNKPEGKGLFIWNNNDLYEGDFALGIKHGYGKYVTKNLTYIGQWKQNIPYGIGTIINKQSKYQGNVISGVKHGFGVEQFKNGDKYTGTFVNGKFQGIGECSWFESKAQYKGMFKNGTRHGQGVWNNSIGDKYQGIYENNRKCGNGLLSSSDGNVYKGGFMNDLKHGYGEIIWVNGEKYLGMWKFDKIDNKIKLLSKTNPINKDHIIKLRRCNTQMSDKISTPSSKLPTITNLTSKPNRLSQLKTQPNQQLTTSMMLRQHSRKFLSSLQTMTCTNKKTQKILFKSGGSGSRGKFSLRDRRLVYDQSHNCGSRRICSMLDTRSQKSLEKEKGMKFGKIQVRYQRKVRQENEEEEY